MNAEKPVLGITMGDATGCGPEIIVKSLAEKEFYQTSRLFVIGDAKIMQRAAGIVGSNLKVRKVDSVVGAGEEPRVRRRRRPVRRGHRADAGGEVVRDGALRA